LILTFNEVKRIWTTIAALIKYSPCQNPESVCAGILWLVKKDKLVVAGFAPGSQAKQAGVICGDILQRVDGKDVLSMKAQVLLPEVELL